MAKIKIDENGKRFLKVNKVLVRYIIIKREREIRDERRNFVG